VPSGRITDILNGRRSITADTAVRLGRYLGTVAFPGQVGTGWPKETRHPKIAQFWLDLQSQYDIAVVEREKGGGNREAGEGGGRGVRFRAG
jgi:plasmid maintenance system antidote protein VapI